jgi:hypothetical protein
MDENLLVFAKQIFKSTFVGVLTATYSKVACKRLNYGDIVTIGTIASASASVVEYIYKP